MSQARCGSGESFLGVEMLRGVAACFVVLYHAGRHIAQNGGGDHAKSLFQFGHAGVDLFFVISGFIICFVHAGDIGRPETIGRYAIRRFTRIYPLYWVVLALTLASAGILHGRVPPAGALTIDISLLPAWGEPLVGIAWTLRHEIFFYVLFAVLLLSRGLGSLLFAGWLGLIAWSRLADIPLLPPLLYSAYNLEFLMGMGVALSARRGLAKRPHWLLGIGLAGFTAAALCENTGILDGYSDPARLAYGLPAALILWGLVQVERRRGLRPPGFFGRLGKASYSIYLFHLTGIGILYKVADTAGWTGTEQSWLLFGSLCAAGIMLGLLMSAAIEYPLMRAMRTSVTLRNGPVPPLSHPLPESRMNILYHHRTASKDGQDVHIEEMIAAFRRQGHRITVVAPAVADAGGFGKDGGFTERLKAMLPGAVYELLELCYSFVAYRKLKRAYDMVRPDILYERYNLLTLPGLWLKRRTGIPYILEVNSPLAQERAAHGGLKLHALARWSERAVWLGADLVLPVTEVLADHVRAAGVPEHRIMVVANGIDRAKFPPGLQDHSVRAELGLSGKTVLGFTGFIRAWHGLPEALDAMAAMPNREQLHMLVVGDGPGLAPLQEHARAIGMEGQLTCLGLVTRDRIAACVAAFDIALQPKVVDYASPLKLFEYMALGRTIIAPDMPNIREVLTDGEDAVLFHPDDLGHFRARIMELCGDADLRQRLGAGASATIERRGFTWDDNARRVVEKGTGLIQGS